MKSVEVIVGLSALAQESRLMLFRLLVKRGPEGYTPTQLMERLGVPAPTLSFHLKELQRASLIKARREGRFLFYSPNFPHMNQLLEFLTNNCCSLADNHCGTSCDAAAEDLPGPKRMRA
jgi:ArsR family transcriptional regulator, arsenate/arsenite/antimonite-responsive transcriptional repressor